MSVEKILNDALSGHLHRVRAVLQKEGASAEDIEDVLGNLFDHALSMAQGYAETLNPKDAVQQTLLSLDAPETYGASGSVSSDGPLTGWTVKTLLGVFSIIFSVSSVTAGMILSHNDLFDTPLSGGIFLIGQLFAFGFGLSALPNIWARLGSICSGLMLSFILLAFLWVKLSGQ